jgi:hypothetical protein
MVRHDVSTIRRAITRLPNEYMSAQRLTQWALTVGEFLLSFCIVQGLWSWYMQDPKSTWKKSTTAHPASESHPRLVGPFDV